MKLEVLRAENISKIYCQNAVSLQALRGVSVTIQKGEFVAVLGRSGSGKSTLLNILAGLDKPSKGKVCIDGTDIFHLSEEKRTLLRREKIGFVFQAYELLHSLTVIENIRLPELTKDAQYVEELLDALKIRQYEKSYPDQLSGGEQQRTAIARALVNHPPILFADEPTGNLDSRTERVVIDLLKSLAAKYGTSILLVTHNEELVRDADRVIRLEDGEIVNG
ncbi:ABC transporter ATP-binding protein [Lachnospiraceae bacterium 56-18]|jgi:putative ABC transport system ATP-binding protein